MVGDAVGAAVVGAAVAAVGSAVTTVGIGVGDEVGGSGQSFPVP